MKFLKYSLFSLAILAHASIISKCCNVNAKIDQLLLTECTPIQAIPAGGLVINTPGCYVVTNELTYNGTTNPAITIAVSDVKIAGVPDFTLALSPDSVGIVASGVKNITIENLSIVSTSPSTNALSSSIFFTNVDNFILQRVRTDSTFRGMKLTSCTNSKLIECVQENHGIGLDSTQSFESEALRFRGNCTNISFDRCQYNNNIIPLPNFSDTHGIVSSGNFANLRFSECSFYNTEITMDGVTGFLIDNSSFIINSPNYVNNFLELGISSPVHGVILQNCTFTNLDASWYIDGIIFGSVSNALIENCVIEANNSGINLASLAPEYPAALIQVGASSTNFQAGGDSNLGADNVTIRNCILRGGSADPSMPRAFHAIYVQPFSNGVVLENLNLTHFNSGTFPVIPLTPDLIQFGDPIIGGAIFVDGATNVVIKNITLSDVASGPEAGRGPGDGIVLGGAYTLTGVAGTLAIPTSQNVTVEDCKVTDCEGTGINNEGDPGANLVVNNFSYNNGTNFAGVPPSSIVNQGDPAVAGQNLLP